MANSVIQFRIDDDLKTNATEIYEKLGLDLSTAIRMFLKRSVLENGIPFSMTLPKTDYNATVALAAVAEMNKQARDSGVSEMTLDEINAEISAFRKERRAKVGV